MLCRAMPSPIAHAVSGYVIVKGLGSKKVSSLRLLAIYGVFVAIAADFDFIPQIVADVNTHRGLTHSVSFAIVVSLILSAAVSRRTLTERPKLFLITLSIYGSHLLLDFLSQGGIPLLWPMSNHLFQATVPLFPVVHHSRGLFDTSHLRFLSFELTYAVVLLWILFQWETIKNRRAP